jgi:branched-chain amino acid transport system substrate-binding protein
MPLRGVEAADGRDVASGARLALTEAHRRVGALAVRAVYLDDTEARGPRPRWSPAAAAANARRAIEDSTAIAYLGDFDSGATRFSLPITNEARMLQVSPASAAVDLVQPFLGAGDQVPEVQHTGQRTFGRVIPSDEVQAQAAALWAKRLRARHVMVSSDGSPFGKVMQAAFEEEARARGLRVGRGPRFVFSDPYSNQGRSLHCALLLGRVDLLYSAGARSPTGLLSSCGRSLKARRGIIAPDSLLTRPALARLRGLHRPLRITSAAQDPRQLLPRGQEFVRRFAARYGRRPGRFAAYGYEAMAVILDSIRRAGDFGDDRDAVVRAFFDTTDRHSVLGPYSIDDVGNTTLRRLTGYQVRDGRAVFDTPIAVP